jgi:hypothetical protein
MSISNTSSPYNDFHMGEIPKPYEQHMGEILKPYEQPLLPPLPRAYMGLG